MQLLTLSALVASTVFGVAHAGVAADNNKSGSPMYLWSVGDLSSQKIELPDRSVVYNETYRARNGGGGISIKICGEPELTDNHTQFEYTIDPPSTQNPKVWYDLSNINGNALSNVDYELKPTDKDCPTVYCPAGASKCKAVYNVWNDDQSTHACSANADLIFTLCPVKEDGTDATTDGIDPEKGVEGAPAVPDGSSNGPASVTSTGDGKPLGYSSSPVAKIAGGAGKKLAQGDDSTSPISYLHPTFAKRDLDSAHLAAHTHQHRHERLRRSRVFRANEA